MEPLNKGHVGDNINSAISSFIERLSSSRGSKCTKTIGHVIVGTSNSVQARFVERFIIQCPYFGGSTVLHRYFLKSPQPAIIVALPGKTSAVG